MSNFCESNYQNSIFSKYENVVCNFCRVGVFFLKCGKYFLQLALVPLKKRELLRLFIDLRLESANLLHVFTLQKLAFIVQILNALAVLTPFGV